MKLIPSCLFAISLLVLSGCSSTAKQTEQKNVFRAPSLDHVILAEPLSVHYKSEVALLKIEEILQRAELTDEQRAQLLYDRGSIYDSIGLKSLAKFDFNRAIQIKPNLADAYNFVGIHHTIAEEYQAAFEAFDAALDIKPDFAYAYLNRGISLYYSGRYKLAAADLAEFLRLDPTDPYRAVWLYIAEREVDEEVAVANLIANQKTLDGKKWAYQITELFAENISVDAFLTGLTKDIKTNHQLAERLCEAYFYIGKLTSFNGHRGVAANFFKLALSTNVYQYVEHKYAKLELNQMRRAAMKAKSEKLIEESATPQVEN